MKSRVTIILALLLVFSAGLAEPLRAAQGDGLQTMELDRQARDTQCAQADDDGSGDTGETQGDPDGWLGGQNFRPAPPISNDQQLAPQSPEGFIATLLALYRLFLIL